MPLAAFHVHLGCAFNVRRCQAFEVLCWILRLHACQVSPGLSGFVGDMGDFVHSSVTACQALSKRAAVQFYRVQSMYIKLGGMQMPHCASCPHAGPFAQGPA